MLAGLWVPQFVALGLMSLGAVASRRGKKWVSACCACFALLWLTVPWLMSLDLLSIVSSTLLLEMMAVGFWRQGAKDAAKHMALLGLGIFVLQLAGKLLAGKPWWL